MKTAIGRAIAGAAAALVRSLGSAQATLVVRPTTAPALPPRLGDAPAGDPPTIRIEGNVSR